MVMIRSILLLIILSATAYADQFVVFLNRPPKPLELGGDSTTMLEEKFFSHITHWKEIGFTNVYATFERGGAVMICTASAKRSVLDSLGNVDAITIGMYIPEVYPITILQGDLCPGDNDMLLYQTVRLIARIDAPKIIAKETAMPHIRRWMDAIAEKADILFAARMDDSNSGALIIASMKRKSVKELILAPQPENIFSNRIRNIWASDGVFCTTTE
jgi:hypothetical protein